ncbi:uncharacterized protein RCC_06725 [Ramularia collo-cygni]|uniref:Uncharacterized protein n=1 Tax=Ramularia collo-cygni TaxID=112498 RepID=A0A2D3V2C8_9PEZI|nr:uncharacterized protein RCC_06725 [Ramularia collo-cygni]CZT20865.1 uncharacterized protein RCC_06725 [Ramularia collo-cygni]
MSTNNGDPVPSSNKTVAYATFYCTRLADESAEDPYFDAVQLLIYQILHRPSTRTQLGIPLLVFVAPHVSQARRKIFRSMGGKVIELDYIRDLPEQIQPRRPRWIDQLCKLRIFEQVSYDFILYLDSDMLLTKSLDDIWDEPVSKQKVKTQREKIQGHHKEFSGVASLPDDYLFVGVPDTYGSRKPDPPIPWIGKDSINGGFWLASPSLVMFQYYVSLLASPNSYDSQYMEQGVFRHAHGGDGPMPWSQFPPGKWNVNWPRVEDFRRGTATLHDRFWITDEPWVEEELVGHWNEAKKEMLGFSGRNHVQDFSSLVLITRRLSIWRTAVLRSSLARKQSGSAASTSLVRA